MRILMKIFAGLQSLTKASDVSCRDQKSDALRRFFLSMTLTELGNPRFSNARFTRCLPPRETKQVSRSLPTP